MLKEVRPPCRTMSFRVEGSFNSPASPGRRGGGKGAGWYVRLTAAKELKEVCDAPPPPLLKGGVKRCPVDIEVRGREGMFGNSRKEDKG